jgi:hypothetical protein
MEDEPKPVRPFEHLTDQELDEYTLYLQEQARPINNAYNELMIERSRRYAQRLGRTD